jgi:trehalose 6-phosphate phosphatase
MTENLMSGRLPPPEPWSADSAALFIDLDGTLASIEPRPEDVQPETDRSRLLRRLNARLNGRLAVVSGRTLNDVDRILEGAAPAVAAVHGLVRRGADGAVQVAPAHPGLGEARQKLGRFAEAHPGLVLEDKGLALALHFRQAPELASQAVMAAEKCARQTGLRLQLGEMVAEVRTPGQDKGAALVAFMAEPPFRDATPIFIGDDLTDEDGFRAAQARGGTGVLVGPGRATSAHCGLADVDEVARWLESGLSEERPA